MPGIALSSWCAFSCLILMTAGGRVLVVMPILQNGSSRLREMKHLAQDRVASE